MNPLVLIGLGIAGLGLALVTSVKLYHPERVLIVGDSHSEASWTFGGRLATKLAEAGVPRVDVAGNRGKGVRWYLESGTLNAELDQHRPDMVIVELGGNDAVKGYRKATYQTYLGRFVDLLREKDVKRIVWLAPTKHEGSASAESKRRQIAAWQQEYLPGRGVEWYDMHPLTIDLPTRDGVHYDQANYEIWATRAIEGPLGGLA